MDRRVQVAKAEYKCVCCSDPIRVGQRYVKVVNPPWEDVEGDECDGRTVYFLRAEEDRRWAQERFHLECEMEYAMYR